MQRQERRDAVRRQYEQDMKNRGQAGRELIETRTEVEVDGNKKVTKTIERTKSSGGTVTTKTTKKTEIIEEEVLTKRSTLVNMADYDKDQYESDAYGRWVNDKLTRAGHNPIDTTKLLKEFYNGTVLRNLLEYLSEGRNTNALKKVNMRPYNKFVVSNNYKVMEEVMTGPEEIDLGGIPMVITLTGFVRAA